jgi:hypothetical protein
MVFRPTPPLVLWWVWLAFVALNLADFAIQGARAGFVVTVCAVLLAVTGLVYTLALRPRVVTDETGVTVVNPFRSHHLPWAAITSVEVAQWVRLHYGDGNRVDCWALYVSTRARSRPIGGRRARLRPPSPFGGNPGTPEPSRLPEDAKYLASLPPVRAFAARLDSRARKTPDASGAAPDASGAAPDASGAVTAAWSWPPIAAVVLPAIALLILALA